MQGEGQQAEPQGHWNYKPDAAATDGVPATVSSTPQFESVSWTASEYIAHHKSFGWFLVLAVGAAATGGLVYLITDKDLIPTIVVLIFAVGFGAMAARQPRVLRYSLDDHGVHIENKFYPYSTFRSFNVIEEGAIKSIVLIPLKRFMMSLTLYFAPDDEEKILSVLSKVLPLENRGYDVVDRFMHKIRF